MSHLPPQTSTLAEGEKKNLIFLLFELCGVIDFQNLIHPVSNQSNKPAQSDFSIPALML